MSAAVAAAISNRTLTMTTLTWRENVSPSSSTPPPTATVRRRPTGVRDRSAKPDGDATSKALAQWFAEKRGAKVRVSVATLKRQAKVLNDEKILINLPYVFKVPEHVPKVESTTATGNALVATLPSMFSRNIQKRQREEAVEADDVDRTVQKETIKCRIFCNKSKIKASWIVFPFGSWNTRNKQNHPVCVGPRRSKMDLL